MKGLYTDKNLTSKKAGISVGLFTLALLPRVFGLDVFITVDEPKWIGQYAIGFLMALMRGEFTATCQALHPGVTIMWFTSAGLAAQYLLEKAWGGVQPSVMGFREYLVAVPVNPVSAQFLVAERLPFAFATSVAVVLVYFLVGKLFNSRIAFLSAAMLAFDPLYLAHSRSVLPDALLTSFMTLSLLSFMICLKHGWSLRYVAFSGIAAGLAFLTKVPAGFLIPFIGILAGYTFFLEAKEWRKLQRRRIWPVILALIVWGSLAAFVFFLLWPAMWVDPVGTVKKTFINAANQTINPRYQLPSFFWGKVTTGPDPGPLFYPVVLLLRVTPLTLLGVAFSLAMLGRGGQERLSERDRMNIVILIAYAFLFTFVVSWRVLKADRFFLPIFPAIEIVAAFGLYGLMERVIHRSKLHGLQKRLWAIGLLLMVLLQAAFCLPYHPHYRSYYSPLFGGGSQASKTIRVGMGEGLEQAARYLNIRGDGVRAASWQHDGCFSTFFLGQSFHLSKGKVFWRELDYVVFYINQVQRQLPDPQFVQCFHSLEPEHTVRIKGIDYAWIYKVPQPLPDCVMPAQYVKQTQFGDQILLLGYDIVENREPFDGKLRINLYWQALREMGEDYTIYLKLINDAYHVWGQQDSRPYWDGLPTNSWKKGQVVGDKREIDILPGTPPGLYRVEIILYDLHSGQTLEPTGGEKPLLGPVEIPRWESLSVEALDIEHSISANLSDKVSLLGYNIESGFRPGDNIHLTLFWQCLEKMDQDYTVFTHLIDEKQNIWGQKDNPPVDGLYPTSRWETGEIVRDQYDILISPEAPSGEYQLEVGMYLAETGKRLEVTGEEVPSSGDRILLGTVVVD